MRNPFTSYGRLLMRTRANLCARSLSSLMRNGQSRLVGSLAVRTSSRVRQTLAHKLLGPCARHCRPPSDHRRISRTISNRSLSSTIISCVPEANALSPWNPSRSSLKLILHAHRYRRLLLSGRSLQSWNPFLQLCRARHMRAPQPLPGE